MNYYEAFLLGVIQGLTEFLPVSSSAHLVLTEHFLSMKQPGVLFELMVHFGTLLSVLVYFRKRIFGMIKSIFAREISGDRRMIYYLITGTIPAVIAALLFEDYFVDAFSSPVLVSVLLMMTGVLLLSTRFAKDKRYGINMPRSLIVGVGQALAILPGISRSGTTISAGLFLGVNPYEAAEFSFLLSIPAICGAIIFKAKSIITIHAGILGSYLFATVIAFLTGLLAVYVLLSLIRKGKFVYFGIYCLVVGGIASYYFI
jgi:undecaprenyl-diphosphatase